MMLTRGYASRPRSRAALPAALASCQASAGSQTMAKLVTEMSWHVAAPSDFVKAWMLDVANWEMMADTLPRFVTSFVKPPRCTWEGQPWRPRSVLVMRSATLGVPVTARCTAEAPEAGEFCRYEHKLGLPLARQKYTYSYSVAPLTETSCELTYRAYLESWASKLSPSIRKSIPGSAHVLSVIEEAWERSRTTGAAPVGEGSAAVAASGESTRSDQPSRLACRSCGAALAPDSAYCHECGAPARERT